MALDFLTEFRNSMAPQGDTGIDDDTAERLAANANQNIAQEQSDQQKSSLLAMRQQVADQAKQASNQAKAWKDQGLTVQTDPNTGALSPLTAPSGELVRQVPGHQGLHIGAQSGKVYSRDYSSGDLTEAPSQDITNPKTGQVSQRYQGGFNLPKTDDQGQQIVDPKWINKKALGSVLDQAETTLKANPPDSDPVEANGDFRDAKRALNTAVKAVGGDPETNPDAKQFMADNPDKAADYKQAKQALDDAKTQAQQVRAEHQAYRNQLAQVPTHRKLLNDTGDLPQDVQDTYRNILAASKNATPPSDGPTAPQANVTATPTTPQTPLSPDSPPVGIDGSNVPGDVISQGTDEPPKLATVDNTKDLSIEDHSALLKTSSAQIEATKADIQQRQQALQVPMQPVEERQQNWQMRSDAALAQGTPSDSMRTLDGQTITFAKGMKDELRKIYDAGQQVQQQIAPAAAQLKQDQDAWNQSVVDHNLSATALQAKVQAQRQADEEQRQASLSNLRSNPLTENIANKQDALHQETQSGVAAIAAKYPEGPIREGALQTYLSGQDQKSEDIQKNFGPLAHVAASQQLLDAANEVALVQKQSEGADKETQSGLDDRFAAATDKMLDVRQKLGLSADQAQKMVKDAKTRPYSVDEKGGLKFAPYGADQPTPQQLRAGVDQAAKDGILNPKSLPELNDMVTKAQAEYDQAVKDAGGATQIPQLNAALRGTGRGAAFMTGAALAAPVGAEIGAKLGTLGGPFAETTVPLGATIIGVAAGLKGGEGVAAGYDKAMEALGPYVGVVNSINQAAKLHPNWAEGGELASFALAPTKLLSGDLTPAVISSGLKYRKAVETAADAVGKPGVSAAIDSARNIAAASAVWKAAGGAVAGGALVTALPYAITGGEYALNHIVGDKTALAPEAPKFQDLATNVGLALVLHGNSLQFKDFSATDMQSVVTRGSIRRDANLPLDLDMTNRPGTLEKAYADAGIDLSKVSTPLRAEMLKPLTPEEQALYENARQKISQLQAQGKAPQNPNDTFEGGRAVAIPGMMGRSTTIAAAAVKGGEEPPNSGGETPSAPEPPKLPNSVTNSAAEAELSATPTNDPDLFKVTTLKDIGDGANPATLSEAELNSVGLTHQNGKVVPLKKDAAGQLVVPSVQVDDQGRAIILQPAIDELAKKFPTTAATLAPEKDIRAQYNAPAVPPTPVVSSPGAASGSTLAQKFPTHAAILASQPPSVAAPSPTPAVVSPTPASSSPSTPPPTPEALNSVAAHMEGLGMKHNVAALKEAAQNPPPATAQPTPPTAVPSTPSVATGKPGDPIRKWFADQGGDLNNGLVKILTKGFDDYGKVFSKVSIVAPGDAGDSGIEFHTSGELLVDPPALMHYLDRHGKTVASVRKAIATTLVEEKRHRLSTLLDNDYNGKPTPTTDPEFAKDLDTAWASVPKETKDLQATAYFKREGAKFKGDWEAKHEWFANTLSTLEDGEVPAGMSIPELSENIKKVVESYFKALQTWYAAAPQEAKDALGRTMAKLKALEAKLERGDFDTPPSEAVKPATEVPTPPAKEVATVAPKVAPSVSKPTPVPAKAEPAKAIPAKVGLHEVTGSPKFQERVGQAVDAFQKAFGVTLPDSLKITESKTTGVSPQGLKVASGIKTPTGTLRAIATHLAPKLQGPKMDALLKAAAGTKAGKELAAELASVSGHNTLSANRLHNLAQPTAVFANLVQQVVPYLRTGSQEGNLDWLGRVNARYQLSNSELKRIAPLLHEIFSTGLGNSASTGGTVAPSTPGKIEPPTGNQAGDVQIPPQSGASGGTSEGGITSPKSSTQFTLKPSQAKPILDFAATIPKKDLYESVDPEWSDGAIEKSPHVTALYGLTEHNPVPVGEKIAGHGPVSLELGKMSLFTTNPDYDVLKVDVKSPSAHQLNSKLRELPYQSDFPDYHPHLTIAYLKKGTGDKYVGDSRFEGRKLGFISLTFSPPQEHRSAIGKPELPLIKPTNGQKETKTIDAKTQAEQSQGGLSVDQPSTEPVAPKGAADQTTKPNEPTTLGTSPDEPRRGNLASSEAKPVGLFRRLLGRLTGSPKEAFHTDDSKPNIEVSDKGKVAIHEAVPEALEALPPEEAHEELAKIEAYVALEKVAPGPIYSFLRAAYPKFQSVKDLFHVGFESLTNGPIVGNSHRGQQLRALIRGDTAEREAFAKRLLRLGLEYKLNGATTEDSRFDKNPFWKARTHEVLKAFGDAAEEGAYGPELKDLFEKTLPKMEDGLKNEEPANVLKYGPEMEKHVNLQGRYQRTEFNQPLIHFEGKDFTEWPQLVRQPQGFDAVRAKAYEALTKKIDNGEPLSKAQSKVLKNSAAHLLERGYLGSSPDEKPQGDNGKDPLPEVSTPEEDAKWLARNPKSAEALRGQVDAAAKKAMPDSTVHEPMYSSKEKKSDKKMLRVYHGTDKDFSTFEKGRPSADDWGFLGHIETNRHGMFFAENKKFAEAYAKAREGKRTISAFLNIKNPFQFTDAQDILESRDIGEEMTPDWYMARWLMSLKHQWEAFDGREGVEFTNWLKSKGYDGAFIKEDGHGLVNADETQNVWVTLDPNQIKSADPITRDAQGRVIPLSERFDSGRPDILHSSPDEKPFYSQLARTIDAKMPNSATVEQVKGILQNPQNRVKADELKWSGVVPWLESRSGKVTKMELQDYLKNEGAVKFEEHKLTAGVPREVWSVRDSQDRSEFGSEEEARAAQDSWIETIVDNWEYNEPDPSAQDWTVEGDEEGGYRVEDKRGRHIEDFNTEEAANKFIEDQQDARDKEERKIRREAEQEVRVTQEADQSTGNARHKNYTNPGGTNYREVVLTSPNVEPHAASDTTHFGDIGEGRGIGWYRASDFTDAKGDEGTLLHEIQSKRHQEGREKGYTSQEEKDELNKTISVAYKAKKDAMNRMVDAVRQRASNGTNAPVSEEEKTVSADLEQKTKALEDLNSKLGQLNAPPPAPYEKTWPLQLFKRALADAVSRGQKWIGWENGETQADRYDLSKQVDKISAIKNDDGTYDLDPIKNSRSLHGADWNYIPEAKLSDYVGKDLASRIIKDAPSEYKEYSGLDLKVGGEGMKGFYDKMLPSMVNDYVKQWGAKVEGGEVPNEEGKQWAALIEERSKLGDSQSDVARYNQITKELGRLKEKNVSSEIHRVNITPEMQKGVKAGQALYSSPDENQEWSDWQKLVSQWGLPPVSKPQWDASKETEALDHSDEPEVEPAMSLRRYDTEGTSGLESAYEQSMFVNFVSGESRGFQSHVWPEALEATRGNPALGTNLVHELLQRPRPLDDVEYGILAHEVLRRKLDRDAAEDSLNAATDPVVRAQRQQNLARTRDDYFYALEATKGAKRKNGQGLNAIRLALNNDYSVARLEAGLRTAAGPNWKEREDEINKITKDLSEQVRKTQEDLDTANARVAEMAGVLAALSEASNEMLDVLKQEKSQSLGASSAQDQTPEGVVTSIKKRREELKNVTSQDLNKLALSLIRSEKHTEPGPLIKRMHEEVIKGFPDATPKSIARAWTNLEKATYPKADPDHQTLRDLRRREAAILKKNIILDEKRLPGRTGPQRDAPSDEARRLERELGDAIKDSGLQPANADTQLKSSQARIITGLKNRRADLIKQVDAGKRDVRSNKPTQDTPEMASLRREIEALNKHLDLIDPKGKSPLSDAQKIARSKIAATKSLESIDKEIIDLQRKIKAGELSPKDKKAPEPTDADLTKLRKDLEAKRESRDELRNQLDDLREAATPTIPDDPIVGMLKKMGKLKDTAPGKRQLSRLEDLANRYLADPTIPFVETAKTLGMADTDAAAAQATLDKEYDRRERVALGAFKRRVERSIVRNQEKAAAYDRNELPVKKTKAQTALDDEANDALHRNELAKREVERAKRKMELRNQTWDQRLGAAVARYSRASLLADYVVLAKLGSAAAFRVAMTPLEDATAGNVVNTLLPGLRDASARYGPWSAEAEKSALTFRPQADAAARSISDSIRTMVNESLNTLKTGQSSLDSKYGGKINFHDLDPHWTDFIGHTHAAIKELPKQNEFWRSFQMRIEKGIRQGYDMTNPAAMNLVGKAAYEDATRAIFMQHNLVNDAWKRAVSALRTSKDHPHIGAAIANTAQTLLPITTVPTNMLFETLGSYIAGVPRGVAEMTPSAWRAIVGAKGVEKATKFYSNFQDELRKLPEKQADAINRHLRKGAVGTALGLFVLLAGAAAYKMIGGLWTADDKRRKGELKPDSFTLPNGTKIPHFATHNPAALTLSFWMEVRRLIDKADQKHDVLTEKAKEALDKAKAAETKSATPLTTGKRKAAATTLDALQKAPSANLMAQGLAHAYGLMGSTVALANTTPFIGGFEQTLDMSKGDNRGAYLRDELGASRVIPSGLSNVAKERDKDLSGEQVQREMGDFTDHIKARIPGLRETLPRKDNNFDEFGFPRSAPHEPVPAETALKNYDTAHPGAYQLPAVSKRTLATVADPQLFVQKTGELLRRLTEKGMPGVPAIKPEEAAAPTTKTVERIKIFQKAALKMAKKQFSATTEDDEEEP